MSSLKLSSHSSRNAKLRPISKRKLSSFRRSLKVRSATDRSFQFHKRSQLFIRTHNETLSVVAMRVSNPDRSSFKFES